MTTLAEIFQKLLNDNNNFVFNLHEKLLLSMQKLDEELKTSNGNKDARLDLQVYEMTFIVASILDYAKNVRRALGADPINLSSNFHNISILRLRNYFHHDFFIPKDDDEKRAMIEGLLKVSRNLSKLLDASEDKDNIEFSPDNALLKNVSAKFKDTENQMNALFMTAGTFFNFCLSFPGDIYHIESYETARTGLQSDLNGNQRKDIGIEIFTQKGKKASKSRKKLKDQESTLFLDTPKNFLLKLNSLEKANKDGADFFFKKIPAIDTCLNDLKNRIAESFWLTLNQDPFFEDILALESNLNNNLDPMNHMRLKLKEKIDFAREIINFLQKEDLKLSELSSVLTKIIQWDQSYATNKNTLVSNKILENIHAVIQRETANIQNVLSQESHEDDTMQKDIFSKDFSEILFQSKLGHKEEFYYKEELSKGLKALYDTDKDHDLYCDLIDKITVDIGMLSSDDDSVVLSTCIKEILNFEDNNNINVLRKALADALYKDFHRIHDLTKTLRLSIELDNDSNTHFDENFLISSINIFASINASLRFIQNLSKLTDDKIMKKEINSIYQSMNIREKHKIKGLPLDELTFFELISSELGIGKSIAYFRHYCETRLDDTLRGQLNMVYHTLSKTPYISDPTHPRGLASLIDGGAGSRDALKVAHLMTQRFTPAYDNMANLSEILKNRLTQVKMKNERSIDSDSRALKVPS
jgi:hypothetical protein